MTTIPLTLSEWRDDDLYGKDVDVECGPMHHEAVHGFYIDSYTVIVDGVRRPDIELDADSLERVLDLLEQAEEEERLSVYEEF
jgi:hypothetical protein